MKIDIPKNNLFYALLIIILGCVVNTNAMQKNKPLNEYLIAMQSEKIEERISALIGLNREIKTGHINITVELKKQCYQMIEDEMGNRNPFSNETDEEGTYRWELLVLASKVNDNEVLPFLLKNITLDPAKSALVERGEEVIDDLLAFIDDVENDRNRYVKYRAIINICDLIFKNTGVVKEENKRKVKNRFIKLVEDNKYLTPESDEQTNKNERQTVNIAKYIREPILDVFLQIGDKNLIPFIENMAINDQYKIKHNKKYDKYLKMSPEERHQKWDEIEALNKETKIAYARPGTTNENEIVEKYPIREKARKVLGELKKKHRIK